MIFRLPVLICVFCYAAGIATAAETKAVPLRDRPEYQDALRASKQGLHEVAATSYEHLITDKSLSAAEATKVSERLVDALLRSRNEQRALAALALFRVPDSDYWKGQALLMSQQYKDAENILENYLATKGQRYADLARLALGQAVTAQGRENTGRRELKELLASKDTAIAQRARILHYESDVLSDRSPNPLKKEDDEKADLEIEFVKACAALKKGEGKAAEITLRRLIARLEEIRNNDMSVHRSGEGSLLSFKQLHDASMVRLAEAYAVQERWRTAERLLLMFLDDDIPSDYYEEAFAFTLRLKTPEGRDDVRSKLTRWSTTTKPARRRALALYYLADLDRAEGRTREAIQALETFNVSYPNHARSSEALRLLMSMYGSLHEDEKVLELAKAWQKRFASWRDEGVDFLTGMIRFSRAEYLDAAALFQKSADTATDVVVKQKALYNMAVCAWLSDDKPRFQKCLAQLRTTSEESEPSAPAKAGAAPASDPSAQLMLAKSMSMAAKREPGAEDSLKQFINDYPGDPSIAAANLALAELCLLALPPRARSAQAALEAASASPHITELEREKVDYTRVWIQEAGGSDGGVITEGLHFLNLWPKSSRRDEMQVKVAQAHYRLQDYAKSEARFELLVEENPDSPYAEVALFFAGKAAMNLLTAEGVDKALTLWAEVVNRNGPLTRDARREQARAKRRQGQESAALSVIDSILTSKPAPEGDERLSLLIEKGELLTLLANDTPSLLKDAAEVFGSIASDGGAPRVWRSRAGVMLSKVYLQMGKEGEALKASFDVVEACLLSGNTKALSPQDYLWLYRAGFAALDMLEASQSWESAAQLADRLAASGGDRATEARDRATRLRLEHFLWEK